MASASEEWDLVAAAEVVASAMMEVGGCRRYCWLDRTRLDLNSLVPE